MLRYIYIGKTRNIEIIVADLLLAASKYDIKDLKILCENELIKKNLYLQFDRYAYFS